MGNAPSVTWPGKSGQKYEYSVYPLGTSFKEIPGNYIYAKKTQAGLWSPCYIGQTDNLSERLGNHEKEPCAKRQGATHIHVHGNGNGERTRKAEEADLIVNYKPPCNDQLVS